MDGTFSQGCKLIKIKRFSPSSHKQWRPSCQSRTQSPLAFWSAGGRPPADQKASGLWVRDCHLAGFTILVPVHLGGKGTGPVPG